MLITIIIAIAAILGWVIFIPMDNYASTRYSDKPWDAGDC